MLIKLSDICVCGHIFDKHYGRAGLSDGAKRIDYPAAFDRECNDTIEKHHNGTYYVHCECTAFKIDNLKYLESRANG